MTMTITRRLVRDQARDLVVDWIRTCELAPGSQIRETTLSKNLGISRTPLREALLCLAHEGMVESAPGRSFRVPHLSLEDVTEIYSLRGALERQAIIWAGGATVSNLPRLEEINDSLLHAGDNVGRWIELDREWHALLVSECPNKRLLTLIGLLRNQGMRYGFLYLRSELCIEPTAQQHARVLEAIRDGQIVRAAELLEANWLYGLKHISEKLSEDRSAPHFPNT